MLHTKTRICIPIILMIALLPSFASGDTIVSNQNTLFDPYYESYSDHLILKPYSLYKQNYVEIDNGSDILK